MYVILKNRRDVLSLTYYAQLCSANLKRTIVGFYETDCTKTDFIVKTVMWTFIEKRYPSKIYIGELPGLSSSVYSVVS